MRSNLHDLALEVGFEVVNVEDGYTDYEYNEKLSSVESVSYIIKVVDNDEPENVVLTFEAIINVLPKKMKKRIHKLIRHSNIATDEKAVELVIFAVQEFKAKCGYTLLKEYGALLGVDIEALGYNFTYNLNKKDYRSCLAQIEAALPMKYAPVLGKIKRVEYKISYIKSNHLEGEIHTSNFVA